MAFLTEVETAILGQLGTLSTGSFAMTDVARPAFITGLAIWILLTGYEVAYGKTQDSVAYILTKLGKICLIGWLALWGWSDVAALLTGLKDAAMGGGSAAAAVETALLTPLFNAWSSMFVYFSTAAMSLTWYDLPEYITLALAFYMMLFCFAVLSAVVAFMGAIGFGMFMIAQVIFGIHILIGPFFLLCLMFPFTQRFFETYIGSVMTSIFALALTFIIITLGANVLGLGASLSLVAVPDGSQGSFMSYVRTSVIIFLSKAGAGVLLIYLFYKVFDLAAALGGGINMGNNLVGGVRSILSDLASKGGKSSGGASNAMSGGGGSSGGASERAQSANSKANSTLTGMALRGGASAAGSVAAGTLKAANAAARGVGAVGRFAYNRYSQNSNRVSSS